MASAEARIDIAETMTLQVPGTSELSSPVLADFYEGVRWMEAGEPRQAVEALTRCVEQAPAFTAGHLCLGVAHAVTSSVYPAIDHLEKAVELEPGSFAAQFTLAKFYFKLRVPQKGYEHASLALDCVDTSEQRRALAQLLKTEREHEKNGFSRPWFNRRFGLGFGLAVLTAAATFTIAVVAYVH